VQFSLIDILSLTFRHSLKYGKYSLMLRKFAYQFSIDIDMSILYFKYLNLWHYYKKDNYVSTLTFVNCRHSVPLFQMVRKERWQLIYFTILFRYMRKGPVSDYDKFVYCHSWYLLENCKLRHQCRDSHRLKRLINIIHDIIQFSAPFYNLYREIIYSKRNVI
jgi:hypothetical protein